VRFGHWCTIDPSYGDCLELPGYLDIGENEPSSSSIRSPFPIFSACAPGYASGPAARRGDTGGMAAHIPGP